MSALFINKDQMTLLDCSTSRNGNVCPMIYARIHALPLFVSVITSRYKLLLVNLIASSGSSVSALNSFRDVESPAVECCGCESDGWYFTCVHTPEIVSSV
jgi:hypothetical protein